MIRLSAIGLYSSDQELGHYFGLATAICVHSWVVGLNRHEDVLLPSGRECVVAQFSIVTNAVEVVYTVIWFVVAENEVKEVRFERIDVHEEHPFIFVRIGNLIFQVLGPANVLIAPGPGVDFESPRILHMHKSYDISKCVSHLVNAENSVGVRMSEPDRGDV